MLNFLRKKKNVKKIMWALALVIVPAFVLWGAGSAIRSKDQPKYAGKIFGKEISFRRYRETLLACRNQALLVYGEDFNRVARLLDFEKKAWERLILLYQARKNKIKVSDKEVIDFIKKLPLFQKQGHFDQKKYKTFLDYAFRINPRDFEEQIREILKIEKLKNKVLNKVTLTEEEIEKAYKNENEKAKALYILIEPQKFADQIHPSYEKLQNYYNSHKSEFKKPQEVNVQYIALYFEQAKERVNVTEEEIQNYYQKHSEEFSLKEEGSKKNIKTLEEVKAQIKEILSREKIKEILEERIWKISDEISEDNASFENVARKNQLEVKETGFFEPQQLIPEIGLSYQFLKTAFSLKVGEISNVIETPKGFFIIKIKEKKEPHIPPLDEIKREVESFVVEQEAWKLAKKEGEGILLQLKEATEKKDFDFKKTAENLSLDIKKTEEFSRLSYIPGIGQSKEFAETAFSLNPGEVSNLIRVPNGYCILSLKTVIPVDEETFAQEKEKFAERLLERKKDIFLKIWLANLEKEANLESNIEEAKQRGNP